MTKAREYLREKVSSGDAVMVSGVWVFTASHAKTAGKIVGCILAVGGDVVAIYREARELRTSERYSHRTVYYIEATMPKGKIE